MGGMRLYYYAGVSTALAAGVVVSAFHQRANFYSACVYLAQSNLCLMILINLILLIYGSFMYGLQRLCFGPLRPIEIEQLYEKAWFAITETCLAMTIFREEVGAWFLVMFVALLTGKVWGWIGDGRVEVLEQQPPANPRLFHFRLSVSLGMSVLYDLWLMSYTINTVIQQARPNMMVMFLFEFAVLGASSISTAFRYCISLIEARVIQKQTHERLIERRREVREERAEMIRQRAAAAEGTSEPPSNEGLPNEEDVDEMDIEVPGWESKGQWILTLDLLTDFVKLGIYSTFFFILLTFYGLPIHIMRDLFMTARSFVKRFTAFMRYRRATQDMNKRYEDASVEDIAREDTCIICREEMRPWSVTNPQAPPAAPGALPPARPAATVNERSRPKKLPCGHILHLGCLKSWLERQQVCPTCRRPVVETAAQAARNAAGDVNRAAQNGQPQAPGQQDQPGAPPAAGRNNRGMRMLNLGPLRLGFGQANLQDIAQGFREGQQAAAGGPRVYGLELGFPRRVQPQPQAQGAPNTTGAGTIHEQIQALEHQLTQEIRSLQLAQQELQLVQLLQAELARLRLLQAGGADPLAGVNAQMPPMPQLNPLGTRHAPSYLQVPHMQRHGVRPNTSAIPAGSPDLPAGVTIPEGWSLLPLQRMPGDVPVPQTRSVSVPAAADTLSQIPNLTSTGASPSNNTSLTDNNDINSQISSLVAEASSSVGSNDSAIRTPPSDTANSSGHTPMVANDPSSTTSASNITPRTVSAQAQRPFAPTFDFGAMNATPTSDTVPHPSLFSAHGTPAADTNRPFSVPAPPPAPTTEAGEGSSSGVQVQDNTNENAELEQRRKEKGKAKAVTVEDIVDDAET